LRFDKATGIFREVLIDSVDLDAQGIGRLPTEDEHQTGKVVFVKGALPGEQIRYEVTREKARFEKGRLKEILKPAVFRRKPQCEWFGTCGGCTMQHLDSRAQLAIKQRALEDNLNHLGKVSPEQMLRPLMGPEWGYRYRARLSVVNRSIKKGVVLVGFHEAQHRYVADMTSCEVLPKIISDLLPALRVLVMNLSIRDRLPQIEVAIGELDQLEGDRNSSLLKPVLVIRNLLPFTQEDISVLKAFSDEHGIWLWTQAKGPETVKPFYPEVGELYYRLPEFGINIPFLPTDFTQVNHQMNRALVGKAIRLLQPKSTDRILDLFCGIGNFTLPIATQSREVVGIEGSAVLTKRAKDNAVHNHIEHKTSFLQSNLFEVDANSIKDWGKADRWLIDPPRDGAFELSKALVELRRSAVPGDLDYLPKRIVYVSCNPATLARDAGVLVNDAGYKLKQAGVMNMFPHTSHVESIAVFDLSN
jgi:23S rRNA (uracil1939-C5)-methyltransferase